MKGRTKSESPAKGVKASDSAPSEVYSGAGSNVVKEAKERKRGGKVHGEKAKMHAGRKPRKSGGRTGSNMNPLSSAAAGTAPSGRKMEMN